MTAGYVLERTDYANATEPAPMKEPMLVYLAGPMRGYAQYNFPAFDSAAAWLREDGYKVISPAELDREIGFDETSLAPLPEGFVEGAMRRDIAALLKVDGIVLLPGWEASSGCEIELKVARSLGLPAWELLADLDPDYFTTGETVWRELVRLEPDDHDVDDEEEGDTGTIGAAATWGEAWERLKTMLEGGLEKFSGVTVPTSAEILASCGPASSSGEVRVTSETGGMKGSKPARFDMIPPDVLTELATHYGKGEAKYPSDPETGEANWQKGYAWSLSVAALCRHLFDGFLAGEDVDDETGSSHLTAVIWHAIALRWFQLHGRGTDDLQGRRQLEEVTA